MKNDISRNTFDPAKHCSRVILQQGRVTLDADWNEQADIQLRLLRTLAADLIGPHGGPENALGFEVITPNTDEKRLKFLASQISPAELERLKKLLETEKGLLGPGRYYVDGLLCENENVISWFEQPDFPVTLEERRRFLAQLQEGVPMLLYLDVWERNITALEDGTIREVALGGPDTAARAKTVWQVKGRPVNDLVNLTTVTCSDMDLAWKQAGERLQALNRGLLKAQVPPQDKAVDACSISPESRYRGAENQLYRVEIHQGGKVGDATPPTFKWSRDNGSVVAAWIGDGKGNTITVAGVRDQAHGFAAGQWVELTDDNRELRGRPGELVQLVKVEGDVLTVDPKATVDRKAFGRNPKVRRWDQVQTGDIVLQNGAVPVVEARTLAKLAEVKAEAGSEAPSVSLEKPPLNLMARREVWMDLEDGIQVQFVAGGEYRTGDYWLIPARVATGDVEWPQEEDGQTPKALPPHGITHHYAPLAVVRKDGPPIDLRHQFEPLGQCVHPSKK